MLEIGYDDSWWREIDERAQNLEINTEEVLFHWDGEVTEEMEKQVSSFVGKMLRCVNRLIRKVKRYKLDVEWDSTNFWSRTRDVFEKRGEYGRNNKYATKAKAEIACKKAVESLIKDVKKCYEEIKEKDVSYARDYYAAGLVDLFDEFVDAFLETYDNYMSQYEGDVKEYISAYKSAFFNERVLREQIRQYDLKTQFTALVNEKCDVPAQKLFDVERCFSLCTYDEDEGNYCYCINRVWDKIRDKADILLCQFKDAVYETYAATIVSYCNMLKSYLEAMQGENRDNILFEEDINEVWLKWYGWIDNRKRVKISGTRFDIIPNNHEQTGNSKMFYGVLHDISDIETPLGRIVDRLDVSEIDSVIKDFSWVIDDMIYRDVSDKLNGIEWQLQRRGIFRMALFRAKEPDKGNLEQLVNDAFCKISDLIFKVQIGDISVEDILDADDSDTKITIDLKALAREALECRHIREWGDLGISGVYDGNIKENYGIYGIFEKMRTDMLKAKDILGTISDLYLFLVSDLDRDDEQSASGESILSLGKKLWKEVGINVKMPNEVLRKICNLNNLSGVIAEKIVQLQLDSMEINTVYEEYINYCLLPNPRLDTNTDTIIKLALKDAAVWKFNQLVINAVDNSKATVLISKIGIGDISPKDVLCANDDDTIFIIDLKAIAREAKNYKEKVLRGTVEKAKYLVKDTITDCIRSNTIKKYLKENHIVLTDEMAAALISRWSYVNGIKKTHRALREIHGQTEDGILKKQIQRYIEDDLSNLEELKASGRGDFYELSVWHKREREAEVLEYYKEYKSAEHAARTLGEKCTVRKYHAVQRSGDDFRLETAQRNDAEFDENGELFSVFGSSNHFDEIEEFFDDKYYFFPHPYKRGDILELIGNKDFLYIVVEDADPAVVEAERKRRASGDFTDINLSVTGIDRKTGRIWDTDGGMHPYDFEYAHIEADTKNLAERIMLEMQKLLLGKWGSVQFIYDACLRLQEEFRESEKRVSLITGIELRPRNVGD